MTDERFIYLVAEFKPIIDSLKELAEKHNLGMVDISRLSTGKVEFNIFEDIDENHFCTHMAIISSENIKTEYKEFTREA